MTTTVASKRYPAGTELFMLHGARLRSRADVAWLLEWYREQLRFCDVPNGRSLLAQAINKLEGRLNRPEQNVVVA